MQPFDFVYRLFAQTFLPEVAHAQIGSTITTVGGNLMSVFSGAGFSGGPQGIAGAVVVAIWSVILPTSVYLIVRSGMSLIISQDEGKLSTAKRTIASTLVGIILVFISQELVVGIYTQGITGGGQSVLQGVIYGILNWSSTLVAALGALMIIVSVVRGIASFGKEDSLKHMRHTVYAVAMGILMISLIPAVKLTLGIVDLQPLGTGAPTNASAILATGAHIVAQGMTYLALLAVTIVVYAGIRMILNFGNEEEFKKSRELINRALIGLVVILLSEVIINFVIHLIS